MSIRESIQRNSAVTTTVTTIIIIAAFISIIMYFTNSRSPGTAATEAYFSMDDGASWFAEDIEKVPPFTRDGKEAVRANVFRCAGGKAFVAFLERFTPEGKKTIEAAFAKAKAQKSPPPDNRFMDNMRMRYGEIKKPGGSQWVNETRDSAAYTAIMKFSCPNGSMDDLEIVMP